ncbi:MAG: inorganic pyrophosphatase [Calditrichaeota bacterium]|nr:inorganic pyrophosphatase [Calditrichota bacterium]
MEKSSEPVWSLMGLLFRAHPWHGVDIGDDAPEIVNAYIEMVPTDTVKYELDKKTGLLKVDRPQRFSSMPPMLYGFIPQTYSADHSANYCNKKTGRNDIKGDKDPLDICILTERPISNSNILVPAVVIGGLRMIDNNEADDKIVAYLRDDMVFRNWEDIQDVPEPLIERLKHYFLTYKDIPGSEKHYTEIAGIYNKEEAYEVIRRARKDYEVNFAGIEELLNEALKRVQ